MATLFDYVLEDDLKQYVDKVKIIIIIKDNNLNEIQTRKNTQYPRSIKTGVFRLFQYIALFSANYLFVNFNQNSRIRVLILCIYPQHQISGKMSSKFSYIVKTIYAFSFKHKIIFIAIQPCVVRKQQYVSKETIKQNFL